MQYRFFFAMLVTFSVALPTKNIVLANDSSYPTPFAPIDTQNSISQEMLNQYIKNPKSIPPEILNIINNSQNLEPPTIIKKQQSTQENTTFSKEAPITGKINHPVMPSLQFASKKTSPNTLVMPQTKLDEMVMEQALMQSNAISPNSVKIPSIQQDQLMQQVYANQIPSMQSPTMPKMRLQDTLGMQSEFGMQNMNKLQDLQRLQIVAAKSESQKNSNKEPQNKSKANNTKNPDQAQMEKEDSISLSAPKISAPQVSATDEALTQIKIQELEEKAKQDDEQAKIRLANAYFNGVGGQQNIDRAFQLIEENAKRGSATAMLELGKMYEAKSPRHNIMRAASYYKQASDYGNIEGKFHLGLLYLNGKFGSGDEALKHAIYAFREGLAKEHAPSMYQLAKMYERGIGFDKDLGQAVQLYRKSAHAGYALSQLQVGLLYENGILVPKNETLAAAWYTKSAEQHNATAQYLLAGMYRQGKGVPKNLEQAKALYEVSAMHNLVDAQFDLGVFYLVKSPYQDIQKAEYWLQKAADQNDTQAREILIQIQQNKK